MSLHQEGQSLIVESTTSKDKLQPKEYVLSKEPAFPCQAVTAKRPCHGKRRHLGQMRQGYDSLHFL